MSRVHMNNIRGASKIRALNTMTETVMQQRDLELLQDIDETIDALSEKREAFDVLANAIEEDIDSIKETPAAIDPEGKIVAMLEETRDRLGEIHGEWKTKCAIARKAPELRADDGVVEAYCDAIEAVARLHNAFNALAWAIGEHDSDFDETLPGSYTNANDLFAAMGV